MNTASHRDLINDYRSAASADLNRLSKRLEALRAVLQDRTIELGKLSAARDDAKNAWSTFALKSRQLEDAARRVAHTALREVMAGGNCNKLAGMLFEQILDPHEGVANDVYVIDNNTDFVVAAIWRGLCRVLEVDPASATLPRFLLPSIIGGLPVIGWRVRGRWLPLIADNDAKKAEAMLGCGF